MILFDLAVTVFQLYAYDYTRIKCEDRSVGRFSDRRPTPFTLTVTAERRLVRAERVLCSVVLIFSITPIDRDKCFCYLGFLVDTLKRINYNFLNPISIFGCFHILI